MKKTIAAGGASALGLAAVGLGAAPAHADHEAVVDLCNDSTDHVASLSGHVASNWFMDCVPQYALAHTGFSIVSDETFPNDFLALNSPGVTVTATNGSDASDYFGAVDNIPGFVELFEVADTPTARGYLASMIFGVESVGAANTDDLPDGCVVGANTRAFVVNYTPASVSFSQLVDGEEWRFDVTAAPAPLYLGLSILDDGTFVETDPMCASSGESFAAGDTSGSSEWLQTADIATTGVNNGTLTPYFGSGKILADVPRFVPAEEPEPEEPALPATGVDPVGTIGLAALFLALGVAGGYLRRREPRA